MEGFDTLNYVPDGTNLIDEVANKGCTSVSWSECRSLRDLALLVFSETSGQGTYKVGSTIRLTTTTKKKARSGGKSSIRGLEAFPPHTDEAWRLVPPRYILLRSISGQSESPTEILCFDVNKIDEHLHCDLASGLWACREPGAPRICSVWEGKRMRWDEDCMRPLDRLAKRAHLEFLECIGAAPKTAYQWHDRWSVLLIDNWNTLHARTPVATSETREIERLYVEVV